MTELVTLRNTLDLTEIVSSTKSLDPVRSCMFFSGLMVSSELQANNLRLEALVHLLLATSTGKDGLTGEIANKLFDSLGESYYGVSEDPVEDVMVALVHDSTGSYRVLEGLWEANTFQLQRFVNLVDRMPEDAPFINLKSSLWSLLKISEAIVERVNLQRFTVGGKYPLPHIPEDLLRNIEETTKLTMFTDDQLDELGIDLYDLSPFVYNLEEKAELLDASTTASPLEKQPIIIVGDKYNIVLPTALGITIRSLVIDFCYKYDFVEQLEIKLQHEYVNHFSTDIPLLGEIKNLPFHAIKNSSGHQCAAQAIAAQDNGLHFQFILAFDDFSGYMDSYFSGISDNSEELGAAISEQIDRIHESSALGGNFRSGVTFIIGCGWGRPISIPFENKESKGWSIVSLSAYDMAVFSQLHDFTSFTFLRLLEARERINEIGVKLFNINGLLNLYGHAKFNDFHLVNHAELPEEALQSPLVLSLDESYVLDVRQEVYRKKDQHITKLPDGKNSMVSRVSGDWYFDDDAQKPLYVSLGEAAENNTLLGLVYGVSRKWWCSPFSVEEEARDFVFRIWDGLCHWIYSLDKVLTSLIPRSRNNDVVWRWEIKQTLYPDERVDYVPSYSELRSLSTNTSAFSRGTLEVTSVFEAGFQSGFHKENNDAERAMLAGLVDEVLTQLSNEEDMVENVLDQVFIDSSAKYTHFLIAQNFKDYVKDSLPSPVFVNRFDNATFRIGIGWLARAKDESASIHGIEETTTYLRNLVDSIWLKIKALCSKLNKEKTVFMLLLNHEALEADAEWWKRTYKSALGLHPEKEEVDSVFGEQITLRNESTIGSRLALEMALCECDSKGGFTPSSLDLTKLMSYTMFMFQMGGVSDAIRYEMIPAKIRIAPTGDILFDQSFHKTIVQPYGSSIHRSMLQKNIKKYADNFSEPSFIKSVEHLFEPEFNHAWITEYGYAIDEGRAIVEFLENEGIRIDKAVFDLSVVQFFALGKTAGLKETALEKFLNSMVLEQRESWDKVPSKFVLNDILPWRFKRRLSAVSRPILKIGDKLIIAPSLLKSGLLYLVRNCHQASFENGQFISKHMQRWIGKTRSEAGHQFNKDVADEFVANGWQAKSDILLSTLLNTKLDRDYGDIDVFAWNPLTGKILLIECKDLEFAKTPSEIAKQVFEFRGVKRDNNGKADRLLKHLERIKVLKENEVLLAKTMQLNAELSLEGCLLFSQLVPVSFSNMDKLKKVSILSFDDIKDLSLC